MPWRQESQEGPLRSVSSDDSLGHLRRSSSCPLEPCGTCGYSRAEVPVLHRVRKGQDSALEQEGCHQGLQGCWLVNLLGRTRNRLLSNFVASIRKSQTHLRSTAMGWMKSSGHFNGPLHCHACSQHTRQAGLPALLERLKKSLPLQLITFERKPT